MSLEEPRQVPQRQQWAHSGPRLGWSAGPLSPRCGHSRPSNVRPVWRSSATPLNGDDGRRAVIASVAPHVRCPPQLRRSAMAGRTGAIDRGCVKTPCCDKVRLVSRDRPPWDDSSRVKTVDSRFYCRPLGLRGHDTHCVISRSMLSCAGPFVTRRHPENADRRQRQG
jgi:hypothetical protein